MRLHFLNSAVIANSKMDYCVIQWIEIHPVDSVIYLLKNWSQLCNLQFYSLRGESF